MFQFQRWLEQDEVLHPQNVARRWLAKLPQESGSQNRKAIWQFVETMALEDLNQDLLNVIYRREVHEPRYEEPIEGNLLNTRTGKLGTANGIIAWPEKAHFGFFLDGERAGNMEIKHPPVIFVQNDKELLAGIIWHELRHAQDWAKGEVNYQEPPSPQFSMGKYARHILEARAYADQLRELLRRVGHPQEVMDMLSSGSEFALDERLHDVALHFLTMLMSKKNESLATWAAPLVTAASMMMPQGAPTAAPPTPITRQADNPARDAAMLLGKLLGLFRFRNFVG
jgi:hypothetical protein